MRAAVLFASGTLGVFEVDAAGRLRVGASGPAALGHVGRVVDAAWVPLPGCVGERGMGGGEEGGWQYSGNRGGAPWKGVCVWFVWWWCVCVVCESDRKNLKVLVMR